MTRFARILSCSCLLLLLTMQVGLAQEKRNTPTALQFRRELIPESLLAKEAKGLIPVRREEFDQLLKSLEKERTTSRPVAWISLSQASLHWNESTLQGTLRLQIENATSQASLLSLGKLAGACSAPRWLGRPQERVSWGRNLDGQLYVQVERSGTLEFQWQLSGKRDPWGRFTFEATLPESSRHAWDIHTSPQATLAVNGGLLELQQDGDSQSIWHWEGSGAPQLKLRCWPQGIIDTASSVLVHSATHCTVQESGLDVEVRLQLDVYRDPLTQLEFQVQGNWQPTSIRNGNQPIPFRLVGEPGKERIQLDFDPPLLGANRRITIAGRATWQENTVRKAPRLIVRQGTWLEGNFQLHVPVEWEAFDWQMQRARWSSPTTPNTSTDKVFAWDWEDAESELSFALRRSLVQATVAQGTTVTFEQERTTAKIIADLSSDQPLFTWEGVLSEGWFIENVQSSPSDSLENWEVIPQGKNLLLRTSWKHSTRAGKPVRLIIQANREPFGIRGMSGTSFPIVRWLGCEWHGLTAVHANSAHAQRLKHESLVTKLTWTQLSTEEQERLSLASDEAALIVRDHYFNALEWLPVPESGRLRADFRTRLEWMELECGRELQATLVPMQGNIERVRFIVRPLLGQEIAWRALDRQTLSARKIGEDAILDQEEWELDFQRPLRSPITCIATLPAVKHDQLIVAPLLSCALAEQQSGVVEVMNRQGALPVVMQNQGLQPLYAASLDPAKMAWQYDPQRNVMLELRNADRGELLSTQEISQCQLTTQLRHDHLWHDVVATISAPPHSLISLTLPPGCRWQSFHIDGEAINLSWPRTSEQCEIRLGTQGEQHELKFSYTEPLTSLLPCRQLFPSWPQFAAQVNAWQWTLVVPARYRVVQALNSAPADWLRTIFAQPLWLPNELPLLISNSTWPGCQVLRFSSDRAARQAIWCWNEEWLNALGWLLFLSAAVITLLAKQRSARATALVVASAGIFLLFIPDFLAQLRTTCLAGVLLGLLLPVTGTLRTMRAMGAASVWGRLPMSILLGLLLCALPGWKAWSQEQEQAAEKIYRVLFPVADDNQPAGDYVYMAETLFTQLHKLQQPIAAGPAYLLGKLTLSLVAQEAAMPVESCQVQLELESLRSGNRLFIPWPKDGSHIVADSMRSDGQSIEWQWSEDGAGFWIQIASIGKHEITFTLQPTARGGEKILSWRWPLPPHTTCRLNMSHELAERLDPISTWGTETEREPSGNLIIDLSEEAEVKLAVKKNSSTTESARVEQLQWARVWLGGSVIEARWKFTHAMSSTEAWQVECPRDCQLLMAAANVPAKATWHVRNGEPSLLEWLPAAPQRETELFALFFCPRDSATPWSFPTFVPQQAELTHSWGAINLSPSTRLKALTGVDVQWLDAQKFTSAWNTKESPQFVVDLQASTPAWTSLKGSADTKINSSTLRWEVYPNQVTWQLSAEIERNPTAFALGAVSVPTGSKIKSIQWISNGNAIPLTWLALPGGRISILSPEALTTSGTMHLVAQLPASDGAKRKVNIPHWESAEKHEMRVEWWRAPVVEVAIASPAAAVVETSTTPQQSNDLLPITAWKQTAPLHNEPTTLEWSSTPHRPEWEAIWTTTLQPWNDSWRCLFAGRVQLQNGTLPTLSFPWPTGWQPPRLLEGDAELTLKPSTTGQVLTISFDVPTIKHQRFVLETQLEAGFKWDRRLPRFRCNQAAEDTYLLRVPGDAAQRWETRGVNEIVNREHPHYQDGFQTYQAVLPDAEVRWQLPLASQQTPRVVFRETIPLSTQVGTSSRWQATWWIDPAGQTSCPLILSPHIKIEHVTIDGVTTVFSPTGLLNLRASDRPQCIRLVYALDAHGAEHPQPGTWSITQQADSNTPATTSILLRLEAVLSLIEQSLESQISDEASFVAWCRWWHTELAREVSELPLNLSQEHPELLDRATTLLKSLSQQSQQPPDLELVEEVNEPTAALDSISIETPLHRWQQGLFSVLIGVLWLGVVFGVAWLCQQPSILEAARRQSIFWHVLGGVAFMLLFSPYWLGAFFTLTAAARVLYWPWSQPAVGGIQSARRS